MMDAQEVAALAGLCLLVVVALLLAFVPFVWGHRMGWRRAMAAAGEADKVQQFLTCGHHAGMAHYGGEPRDFLYCEACDDKQARSDAEEMERVNLHRARVAEAKVTAAVEMLRQMDKVLQAAPDTAALLDDETLGTEYRRWRHGIVQAGWPESQLKRIDAAGAAVQPLIDEP